MKVLSSPRVTIELENRHEILCLLGYLNRSRYDVKKDLEHYARVADVTPEELRHPTRFSRFGERLKGSLITALGWTHLDHVTLQNQPPPTKETS